ncbi:MAG: hypothetical protein AW12_02712 [Candidatus Accumulibacter sp. BA-94]|nr:MAG: hypothetical protein AW12_02712 [Candidatus Accumulibacter sp. BA-94]
MTVLVFEVCDVVHGGDHKVDRDDVDAAAFDADGRHPRREALADFLDQLEEVVGTVDLVHFAGARVADDDRRAEDTPRDGALLAHDRFGVVLGTEVGVVEVLRFVEHVLAKQAFVESGGGNRADQVKVLGADCLGQPHGVARAVHIGELLLLGAGLEVVDGRQVKEVLDLAFKLADIGFRDAQIGLPQVANDGDDALVVAAPVLVQLLQSGKFKRTRQEIDHTVRAAQ